MADLDWIFGATMVASTMLGMVRGLVKEVLSWLSWVAAFLLAQRWAPEVSQWITLTGASETLRFAAGFVIAFGNFEGTFYRYAKALEMQKSSDWKMPEILDSTPKK